MVVALVVAELVGQHRRIVEGLDGDRAVPDVRGLGHVVHVRDPGDAGRSRVGVGPDDEGHEVGTQLIAKGADVGDQAVGHVVEGVAHLVAAALRVAHLGDTDQAKLLDRPALGVEAVDRGDVEIGQGLHRRAAARVSARGGRVHDQHVDGGRRIVGRDLAACAGPAARLAGRALEGRGAGLEGGDVVVVFEGAVAEGAAVDLLDPQQAVAGAAHLEQVAGRQQDVGRQGVSVEDGDHVALLDSDHAPAGHERAAHGIASLDAVEDDLVAQVVEQVEGEHAPAGVRLGEGHPDRRALAHEALALHVLAGKSGRRGTPRAQEGGGCGLGR